MSGGSFDYAYYKVYNFVEELNARLQEIEKDPSSDYKEVFTLLREVKEVCESTAILMKETEWMFSGDTGKETFRERAIAALTNLQGIT